MKYTLNYFDNSRFPENFLKIKREKSIYIDPIRINLFKSFIINKQSLFIFQKELTIKQKIRYKQFTIYSIISTMQTKTTTISF